LKFSPHDGFNFSTIASPFLIWSQHIPFIGQIRSKLPERERAKEREGERERE